MMHVTTMNADTETTTSKAHNGMLENGVDNETFISVMMASKSWKRKIIVRVLLSLMWNNLECWKLKLRYRF